MKKILIIFLGIIALILLKPSLVSAVDNMCNVNLDCGTDQSKWEAGWGAARQAENSNATPNQPEWTNATSDPQPQVIRLAGEDNSVNRSDIAAKDEQQRGWGQVNGPADDTLIPTTGSVANNDLRITGLPADVSSGVAALNQRFVYPGSDIAHALSANDFGGKAGVWGEYGNDCKTSTGADPDLKDTSAICSGALKIYYCNPNQIKSGPTRNDSSDTSGEDVWIPLPGLSAELCNTPNKTLYCTLSHTASGGTSEGGGPICTENKTETTKSTDCVSEANRTCKFVQIDVGGSAVTCYPTDYSKCGATAALVTTSVPPPQGPSGGNQPPATQENPPGGPTPTPTAPPPGSSFQCQQVKVFRNNVEITTADIQLGDTIVFRGFATAVGTTVSKLRFTLTKAGIAQTPVDIDATLVGGQYQADYTVNMDTAASYSVTATPVSP